MIYEIRSEKLKENGYKNYQDYLNGNEWKEIKSKIRQRKGAKWNFCNVCGSDKYLDVHHSSYKVIGIINPGNTVKILCRECHYSVHLIQKENKSLNLYQAFRVLKKQRMKKGLPLFSPGESSSRS